MESTVSLSIRHGRFRRLSLPSAAGSIGFLLYLGLTLGPVGILGWDLLLRARAEGALPVLMPRTWQLLGKSLGLAALVSVLAAVLGAGVAIMLVLHRGWLKRTVGRTFVAPLLIPPYIYALAWLALLSRQGFINRVLMGLLGVSVSPYGFYTTALVLSLVFSPIVALMTWAALEDIDPELIEAARVLCGGQRVWSRVALPLSLPSLLAGMGLVFALTLVEYGVPALMQFNVYSMEIYAEFSQSGDPVQAMMLAVPLLLPAMILVAISQRGWGQTPLRRRVGGCRALANLPVPPILSVWFRTSVVAIAVGVLIPVVILFVQSGWGRGIVNAASAAQQEILLSLLVALAAAVLTVLIAIPCAYTLAHNRTGWLWALYALPLAVPAPLFAIGLIHVWNQPWGTAIYGGPGMLLLAYVGRFLPYAAFALVVQIRRTDPLLHEAARLHPVGWHRRVLHVHLPLLSPGLLAAAMLVFVLTLGELGASLLVVPPGAATVSLRLFNLLHYGANESVAGLALVVLLMVGLIGGLVVLFTRRKAP